MSILNLVRDVSHDRKIPLNVTIIKKLGEGVYGRVSEAIDDYGNKYAVKEYKDYNVLNMRGVINEAYYGDLFNHPNIIKPLEAKITTTEAQIVMPLAETDLASFILGDYISIDIKLKLIYQICSAFEYMTRGGFVHCDIKPDNILISQGNAKITDMGLTRLILKGRFKHECEVLHFRSPEQYQKTYHMYDGYKKIEGYYEKYGHLEWSKNDFKGEMWSIGVIFLSIIYQTSIGITITDDFTKFIEFIYEPNAKLQDYFADRINKIVSDENDPLIDLTKKYLIQIDPKDRNVHSFMESPIFDDVKTPYVPFIFPTVDVMYKKGGIPIDKLKVLFSWFAEISNEQKISIVVLSNTIDYIIQHAHQFNVISEWQLIGIVVLYTMDCLYYSYNSYLNKYELIGLCAGIYDDKQFDDMFVRLFGNGKIVFESLYFWVQSDEEAILGLKYMIHKTEDYISYGTPGKFAKSFLIPKLQDSQKTQKTNRYLSNNLLKFT